MDRETMRARAREILARFSGLKHEEAKRQVLCAGGHYSRVNSDLFDQLIDELVAAGAVLRDQRFGWLRLPPRKTKETIESKETSETTETIDKRSTAARGRPGGRVARRS